MITARTTTMKNLIILSIALMCLTVSCKARAVTETLTSSGEQENSLTDVDAQEEIESGEVDREWIKMSKKPPSKMHYHIGQTVELECEIVGSPAPIVSWVRGTGQFVNFNDFKTNVITDASSTAMARVVSRLIIDRQLPGSEHSYTCVGRAGSKVESATTIIHFSHKQPKPQNLLGLLSALDSSDEFKKLRITHYYEDLYEVIGSNVILPCKTSSKADMQWLNVEGQPIAQEPRFKTLPTGELLITNLRWTDMGTYTCVAKNSASKDVASTFVYPLANEN